MIRKWNWWQKTLAVIFTILSIIAVGLVWVINLPQFGSKPSGQHLAAISNSTQYAESNFQNPTAIDVHFGFDKIVQLMGAYTESKEGMQPSDSLPILHPDLNLLKSITE